jgi:hypothetical protein
VDLVLLSKAILVELHTVVVIRRLAQVVAVALVALVAWAMLTVEVVLAGKEFTATLPERRLTMPLAAVAEDPTVSGPTAQDIPAMVLAVALIWQMVPLITAV